MIKMIAMDMDGTLLNGKNKILPETKDILLKIQKQGVRLVLASGRSYHRLMSYAKELEMEQYGGFLVEVNGLAIYDLKNDRRTIKKRMTSTHIHELFTYFKQWKVEIVAHVDDGLYDYNPPEILAEKKQYILDQGLPSDHPFTGGTFTFVQDNRKGYPRNIYIQGDDEILENVNKLSVTYHIEVMDEVSERAKADLLDRYWVGRTSPKWLEIMLLGITKASGLSDVAKECGISKVEIMAFGDGENDIEMLEEAGISIAMENAMQIVKESASEITASNEHNGIAVAIKKHFDF